MGLDVVAAAHMIVVMGRVGTACTSHAEHNSRYNTSTSTDAVNGTMTWQIKCYFICSTIIYSQ